MTVTDRAVHVIFFEGFADWEPAHALAELRRYGKRQVRSVGFTASPVVSMGGLRVTPDTTLDVVEPREVELLLLPGGDMWQGDQYDAARISALVRDLLEADTPVAAICGATVALARAGVLDDRRHTSNAPDYLTEFAPAYRGRDYYVTELAVRDRHVVTASGLGSVDFAREIFADLDVFSGEQREMWFDLFKHAKFPTAAAEP